MFSIKYPLSNHPSFPCIFFNLLCTYIYIYLYMCVCVNTFSPFVLIKRKIDRSNMKWSLSCGYFRVGSKFEEKSTFLWSEKKRKKFDSAQIHNITIINGSIRCERRLLKSWKKINKNGYASGWRKMIRENQARGVKSKEGEGSIDRPEGNFLSLGWFFFLNMQFSNIFRSYDDSRVAVY